MKTKTIFKMLALAMLMPTMLLTTACSNSDDEIITTETPANTKGYALPVTINVTRQGDATTRATFDGSKLSFSTGDKLFVSGFYDNVNLYDFTGVLTWQPGDTFSGTIYLEEPFEGTAEELLSSAIYADATLLPAGYGGYGFLSIEDEGTCDAALNLDYTKAFALTKATAVEQFSYESAEEYNNGFALTPSNAIVSFTISGLAANTTVAVLFKDNYDTSATPVNITTDESGVATFASAMPGSENFDDYSLTVGGNAITLPADKEVEAGKIYNISRSVAPAGPTAYTLTASTVGMIVGSDGKAYAVADKDNLPDGVTAVGMVAYKGKYDASMGSVIALTDESDGTMSWANAQTACANKASVGGYSWKIPDTWIFMFESFGGNDSNCTGLNTALVNAGGDALKSGDYSVSYWIESVGEGNIMYVNSDGSTASYPFADPSHLRLCFDFDE